MYIQPYYIALRNPTTLIPKYFFSRFYIPHFASVVIFISAFKITEFRIKLSGKESLLCIKITIKIDVKFIFISLR